MSALNSVEETLVVEAFVRLFGNDEVQLCAVVGSDAGGEPG